MIANNAAQALTTNGVEALPMHEPLLEKLWEQAK